ncbi:hypothetical protein LTR10_024154 [Elasticomyces elasticus]|uniref:Uncharacterized protein n=1 Tax=Exophiala sideris TaxID=1016849 RepID=A0ABR0IUC4_9EURO|nr:hypothetical protein LTR10_024154 [Elasticomyces elasticus]KAK5020902.1 hypothetical protein LTS07_011367 [Exophiala sideris]KAK5023105.1 hypothetical protein LTR13_011336 [Exophiala sideris]KAK5048420.1 hypothetical protein LTR69_011382 [Exophiala sideris]KAK5176070.1 hypothetical protein LTR44_011375 [Eurotiomycetes sp. CCFEE 6388]
MSNLATVLQDEAKYAQAEEIGRRALAAFEKTLGADHPDTLTSASNLVAILQDRGKYEQADQMYYRTLRWDDKAPRAEYMDSQRREHCIEPQMIANALYTDLPMPMSAPTSPYNQVDLNGAHNVAVSSPANPQGKNMDAIPGLAYFAKAADILGELPGGTDVSHIQANLLAGLYMGQLARLLPSYFYINKACWFLIGACPPTPIGRAVRGAENPPWAAGAKIQWQALHMFHVPWCTQVAVCHRGFQLMT